MINNDLSAILKRLPRLSAAELLQVEDALKLAKSHGGNVVPRQHGVAEPWGEHLLDCIVEVTRETVGYPIAKETLRGMTNAYNSFRSKLPALILYIEHAATDFHQRRAICKLGIELLFGYLHRPDRMTGPSTLMYQIHRMPDALDAQFPGWAGTGLLGILARRAQTVEA